MMNTEEQKNIGLTPEKYNVLSQEARYLYTTIYDYCTYSSDPQYQNLHLYRNSINKLPEPDRSIMIEYFNNDPAIRWNGMSSLPFEYYRKPYHLS